MTPLSIVFVLISALIHSSWNFFTKRGNWPVDFFFWVFLWGIILYLPFFFGFGVLASLFIDSTPNLWGIVLLSGFFQTIYVICLLGAYRLGDLSIVYPLSRSTPLFTQLWAVFLIGEVLSVMGIIGIAMVIIGIFVISLKDFHPKSLGFYCKPTSSLAYLLALVSAITGSIYSVIDKIGVQIIHPIFYLWLINIWMTIFTGLYLFLRKGGTLWKIWQESKKETFIIAILQNVAYLLVLMALQMSKVSYVVAFRQAGVLFAAAMGVILLKESYWKPRMIGAFILTLGLFLIGLAK